MAYSHDTLTRNRRQKPVPKKPVSISDAFGMQFGIEFFWYQILVGLTKRTCSIFVPVYGTSFLVWVFGADFMVCVSLALAAVIVESLPQRRLAGKKRCAALAVVAVCSD